MKIPNKWELQQIAFNHSKPYSFLVIDVTLASNNFLRFTKILSERISKLIMTIDDKLMVRWKNA